MGGRHIKKPDFEEKCGNITIKFRFILKQVENLTLKLKRLPKGNKLTFITSTFFFPGLIHTKTPRDKWYYPTLQVRILRLRKVK